MAQTSAEQVEKILAGLNDFPMPRIAKSQRLGVNGSLKIFNVSHKDWKIQNGSLGLFYIPACEKGQPYSRPLSIPDPLPEPVRLGDGPRLEVWDAIDVAKDVLGIGYGMKGEDDKTKWGVFVAEGDEPTEEELAKANAAYTLQLKSLIAEADQFWNEGPLHHVNITSEHRMACDKLKVTDRPWNKAIESGMECPGCSQMVNPNAAVHPVCGAVLNEEKVISLKLKGYEHLWKTETPRKKTEA